MQPQVNIVGGGLAGSLMAIYTAKRGRPVTLWERRGDLRLHDGSAGKSINLAISTRGLTALDQVGLKEAVLAEAVAMPGRMLHDRDGTTRFQAYGQEGQAIQSVSRRRLNEVLLTAAEEHGVTTVFNARCDDLDLETGAITVDGHGLVPSALTIGADGVFSAIRQRMQRSARFNYEQTYVSHGYTELCISADANGKHKIEANALHIWPRQDFMLIALPNFDGSFTVTLFLRFEADEDGGPSYEQLQTPADVRAFFEQEFADAAPLIDDLDNALFVQPPAPLCTVRCSPHHRGDRVAIIGDAAHAVVPFYGQGMNAAFESAKILDETLAQFGADQGTALKAYSARRVDDAHAIRQLALDHFTDMSASTNDDTFLQARALEVHLEKMLPDYRSLYGMVSFSNIPYAQAVAKAEAQGRLLARMGELVQH